MFERFTTEARAAVVGAQQVAVDTAGRRVDTRHLLVALVAEPGRARTALGESESDTVVASALADLRAGSLDAEALRGIGIDLDAVRRQADATFGTGALDRAGRTPGGHVPFAPDAKKALELSLREAIRLKERGIRDTHLLLGILRAECPGRAVLVRSGVDVDVLRRALEVSDAA